MLGARPLFALVACLLSAGCLPQTIRNPELLSTTHDRANTFVVQRPFDEVHMLVVKTATKCYAMVSSDMLMPAGKNVYVPTGGGVHREVDDKVVGPEKLAMVSIVVRGGPAARSRKLHSARRYQGSRRDRDRDHHVQRARGESTARVP